MNKINEEMLKKVSGGTAEFEDLKKEEFEKAWDELKLDRKNLTGTELEDLFTQWQIAGYKPDAVSFLKTCKTI